MPDTSSPSVQTFGGQSAAPQDDVVLAEMSKLYPESDKLMEAVLKVSTLLVIAFGVTKDSPIAVAVRDAIGDAYDLGRIHGWEQGEAHGLKTVQTVVDDLVDDLLNK